MEQSEVMERVVKILTPWVKDEGALASVSMETNILEDLKVNSARLVDVVIAFEDDFDIEIADEDVDQVKHGGRRREPDLGEALALPERGPARRLPASRPRTVMTKHR